MNHDPLYVKQNDPRLKLSQTDVDFARDRTAALRTHFNLNDFRPGQAEAIDSLQHGRDVLAVLPTGSGKTLIYELATYLINKPCLIVSPLLSLMQDQVGRLNQRGERRAVAINSLLTKPERMHVLQRLDQYRFIYVSPEMLLNVDVQQVLKHTKIGLFVVDEAHCISTWGPDFRPAYLSLGTVRNMLNDPLTLALTATADSHVREDIRQQLNFSDEAHTISHSVNRPNIFLDVEQLASRNDKAKRVLELMQQVVKPGIIYFSSKAQADEWANRLSAAGYPAASYHAGLSAQTRYTVQTQFMQGQLQVVCATSAFGMGIDKGNIRFVIHYHIPGNLNDYVQEIGRAGRAGHQSVAILLMAPGDQQLPADLVSLQLPTDAAIADFYHSTEKHRLNDQEQLIDYYKKRGDSVLELIDRFQKLRRNHQLALRKMLTYAQSTDCLRQRMLSDFGEPSIHHDDDCCAVAGQTLPLDALGLSATNQVPTTVAVPDWQTQIRTLFSENFTN